MHNVARVSATVEVGRNMETKREREGERETQAEMTMIMEVVMETVGRIKVVQKMHRWRWSRTGKTKPKNGSEPVSFRSCI